MNSLEKQMVETLIDLHKNYNAVGVKAEFETEGTRVCEALRLKELVTRAGLELSIKIGGCAAVKDLYEAKTIGVSAIIAPMVETPYAMKKYVQVINSTFTEEEKKDIKFLINIETITGFANLKEMVATPEFSAIEGVVFGRVDMTGSMGLPREEVDSKQIFDIASSIAVEMQKLGKEMIIGGEVCAKSIKFFNDLPANTLSKFETRKIIFDAPSALKNPETYKGILKAIEFELMWLKNKRNIYGMVLKEDETRLATLEARYQKIIKEAGSIYA